MVMKELSIEEKAKAYDKVVGKLKQFMAQGVDPLITRADVQDFFPELKESEDEKIRKVLIGWFNRYKEEGTCGSETFNGIPTDNIIAWLEKQVPVDEDEIVKGIRRGVAISLMNHIDANSKGMCLSNMECEDIENAIVNEDWDKVYGYMKKKLEKQGEPTEIISEFDSQLNRLLKQFESLPKEELASSLSFYLNVVQNDGTYKDEEEQGEQNHFMIQ